MTHVLEQCVTAGKIFDKKDKAGNIQFQEGAVNINNLPSLKHSDRFKAHAMVASHCEVEIERDYRNMSKGKLDLDMMAQGV